MVGVEGYQVLGEPAQPGHLPPQLHALHPLPPLPPLPLHPHLRPPRHAGCQVQNEQELKAFTFYPIYAVVWRAIQL